MPVLLSLPGNWDEKLMFQACSSAVASSIVVIVSNGTVLSTSLAEYRGKYVSMPLSVLIGYIGLV
jgi:hypothetical protein